MMGNQTRPPFAAQEVTAEMAIVRELEVWCCTH